MLSHSELRRYRASRTLDERRRLAQEMGVTVRELYLRYTRTLLEPRFQRPAESET